jgi:type I restriction enzyme S subunit
LEEYAYDCPAIVLSAVGARCGKAFKADGRWGVVANTHCLFPLPNSDRDYLWYLTNQEDWWEKSGSAQPFVKVSETMARPWVFPPLSEQTAIAEFLDTELAKFDALTAEAQRAIDLLQERRTALISAAVTGQIDVRQPPEN